MINNLTLEGFAIFKQPLEWRDHGRLNLIIGENDTGKTHLLKLLYAVSRSAEECWKKAQGPDPVDLSAVLATKLRWVFLPQKLELGRLVSRGGNYRLNVRVGWHDNGSLRFEFGKDTTSKILQLHSDGLSALKGTRANYLPPKEILSIFDAIVATRESQEIAAFDDTYYDLMQDFRQPTTAGRWQRNVEKAVKQLDGVTCGGEVEMDANGIWFKRGNERYNMHQTAEGIKKIGILHRLMRNRRLTPTGGCLLFVDEPETNLHPKAVVRFAEMLFEYARAGIQVYATTHSYFLMKRLEQLARDAKQSDDTLLDLRRDSQGEVIGQSTRLADGLPDNPIIEQSMQLFDEDVRIDLGL
ncbi:MAG: AAA family ATPase [Lamprobacter sp.]|uniref:AAA family ATPase n=1 Tax=Lamprobacter sp. TaxID=3100796 RepID=UPI002B25AB39|nr:AAA family ATPase [Lamprobacter sp.]MEA3641703.1 AAA family ATPase [Lamprobacter sp.]